MKRRSKGISPKAIGSKIAHRLFGGGGGVTGHKQTEWVAPSVKFTICGMTITSNVTVTNNDRHDWDMLVCEADIAKLQLQGAKFVV